VTDTYDYDAFGNLIASTGSTPNNYRFAGEQFDPVLGIYYNRARYYDQRQGRFWSMDTWEGDPQSPGSLHKYLYAGANSPNNLDPSGHDFDLGSVTSALGSISAIAATALVATQNALNIVYYNLYRVPQVIDTVSTWLLYVQGSVQIAAIATDSIEQMASNLENTNAKYSTGPSAMGSDVELAGGANFERNTQSYDYYDAESQTVIQLKGTRQISSPTALMGVVRGAVNNIETAPSVVQTFYRGGGPAVDIVKANLKVRAVVVAIPTEPVTWNFAAFLQEIEQLEQNTKIIVKIVPSPGFD
jgi:RHS repeat-associated protein